MKLEKNRAALFASAALTLAMASGAAAQTTPGDQSGTATPAGAGQSAATPTNAPASTVGTPTPSPAPVSRRATGAGDVTGEVIVTARRVEERLQDVPISITVFNQQQLANRNIIEAQDLATYTPSLSTDTNFGNENTAFAIRGFVQEIGTQPSVGVYFADVVEPRAASNNIPAGDGAGPGDFFDLQNVQVLKGPQGTLFGRNTTGGAVLLVPQKPTGRTEGYLEISAGDYNMNRIQGVFNTPITDKLRLRVGVDHEARDGYAINDTGVGPSAFDDIDYTALRGSLVWDVLPNVENYTIASYTRSDTNGNNQKLTGCLPNTGLSAISQLTNLLGSVACAQLAEEQAKGAGFYTVQNNPLTNPNTTLATTRVINTTTWRASDNLTVKNIASFARLQENLLNPIFGTNFDLDNASAAAFIPGVKPGTIVGFAYSAPYPDGHTAHESTLTEEAQVQGNLLDNRLQYQAGLYYEASVPLDALDGSQSPVLINCSNLRALICNNPLGEGDVNYTLGRTSYHNEGVYTQATYGITDQLKLTGGFRYTWDHERSYSILRSYAFPMGVAQSPTTGFTCTLDPTNAALLAQGCSQVITQRSSAPTGTVDLDYKPINDLLLYIKYSRGYRAGGVVPEAPAPFQTYQPEHVNAYELGEKYTIHGPVRGTLDVTGFYNDLNNQQLQSSLNPREAGVGPASGIINAGSSRIYGVEFASTLNLFEGFTLDIGYTYLNTALTSVPTITTPATSPYSVSFPAQVGDPTPLAPENKYTITGTYVLPIDRDYGRVALAATFTHIDRQLTNYPDLHGVDGMGDVILPVSNQVVPIPANVRALAYDGAEELLNFNLNWNSVMRSNFDIQGFVTNATDHHYYTFTPGLFASTEFETSQLGEPRMFGFRVRYHFGS